MHAALSDPHTIHPSLWRASQLAGARERCVDTGYAALSAELPGGGWPVGTLVELLVQQPGIGEMRLLRPALRALGHKPLMLLQPPHQPNSLAFANWQVPTEHLYLIETTTTADALWTAEQILRAGSCAVLLFWQQQIRTEALRRLHLAAQAGDTLFLMIRPLAAVQQASPAPLRLSLTPAEDGVAIRFVKRRGPAHDAPLVLPLAPLPVHRKLPAEQPAVPQPEAAPLADGR
ncbi:translesion DNA synthesis-associated protein ImuA [Chitinasiproducens palmae]|uniref:Protein ImuA n=1 Tax=Chitinasiproducens palmae TaxID=1770053 RepID=A0A1H2PPK3_9BURK|nr:translesion DNA synthesis-associated protein ImuA [Chitinasiproducens palmae]SDV48651.1 protein ImuA [Chitinasiproducens palmae]